MSLDREFQGSCGPWYPEAKQWQQIRAVGSSINTRRPTKSRGALSGLGPTEIKLTPVQPTLFLPHVVCVSTP